MNHLPAPAADWAIFLDLDGTLIEIADHPETVRPARQLPTLLKNLAAALDGAVALVSGRSIAAIDRLTGQIDLAAAGLHGLELRTADGGYPMTADEAPTMASARRCLQELVKEHADLYLEDKTATLALHYRGARQPDAALETARRIVRQANGQLELLAGKSVVELKPAGYDKGQALRALLDTPPFAGRRPVYIGDDVTDEHGFAAVNDLGGISIRVGDNHQSAARYHLATVNEVLEWLQQITRRLAHPSSRST